MKKLLALGAVLLFTCTAAFSQVSKTFLAIDYNIGYGKTEFNMLGTDLPRESMKQGFDFDAAWYPLFNGSLGVYANFGNNFLMNKYGNDIAFKFDATAGLSYRMKLTDSIELNLGAGPHVSMLSFKHDDNSISVNSFGAAALVGVRYSIFNVCYINAGVTGHYDFYDGGCKYVEGSNDPVKLTFKNAYDFRGYLGFGIIIDEIF